MLRVNFNLLANKRPALLLSTSDPEVKPSFTIVHFVRHRESTFNIGTDTLFRRNCSGNLRLPSSLGKRRGNHTPEALGP